MDSDWVFFIAMAIGLIAIVLTAYNNTGGSMTQAHENFKTFRGTWLDMHTQFQTFAASDNVQIKSISFMPHILSVGYVDGAAYPVHLEDRIVDENDLDTSLSEIAAQTEGDVICHSLYRRDSGTMACVFLIHKG